MPAKTKTLPPAKKTGGDSKQQTRLWLMYPPKLIKEPLIWQLSRKFPVVTNIRQASVTDEIGIVSLELDGQSAKRTSRPRSSGSEKSASASSPSRSTSSRVKPLPSGMFDVGCLGRRNASPTKCFPSPALPCYGYAHHGPANPDQFQNLAPRFQSRLARGLGQG